MIMATEVTEQLRESRYDSQMTHRKPSKILCQECGAPQVARQLCRKHYTQWKRKAGTSTCTLCDRPYKARGLCEIHWYQWRKTHPAELRPRRARCRICGEPNQARQLCRRHYQKWRKYGDPEGAPRLVDSRSARERAIDIFKRKTLIPDGDCLLYPMRPDVHGYGQINTGVGVVKAHRAAWEAVHGPIDGPTTYVDHKCWNPACCNVEHLRLTNHSENLQNRRGADKRSKTGLRGVIATKAGYEAKVTVRGKTYRSQAFDTAEEAGRAAAAMRRELMPFSEMDKAG